MKMYYLCVYMKREGERSRGELMSDNVNYLTASA